MDDLSNYGSSFEVGELLGLTWSTLFKNPAVFFGLPALASVCSFILSVYLPDGVQGIISFILSLVIQGAFVYGVFQSMTGGRASFGSSFSRGLARFFPILGTVIIYTVVFSLGLILFLVPGVIVMNIWHVAVPCCVVERTGVMASLRRSSELTKGYRWQIFGLTILVFLMMGFLAGIAGFASNAV
ncbi:MAG: hypothetical protein LBR87_05240, partial [Synergistaceae bacterium]|nr:hypothetical protein [Synergistaceae bacterium]